MPPLPKATVALPGARRPPVGTKPAWGGPWPRFQDAGSENERREDNIVDEALEKLGPDAAPTRRDLQALSRVHARGAAVLLRSGIHPGAYYLAGLSLECALKACIARRTRAHSFYPNPKFVNLSYSHNLGRLLEAAGLNDALREDTKQERALEKNWELAKRWHVGTDARYHIQGAVDARGFVRAVIHRSDGVLAWVRRRW